METSSNTHGNELKKSRFGDLEIDLDNINFSALDQGLGFHQKDSVTSESKSLKNFDLK